MTSSLHAGDGVLLDAEVTGTMSFQNPVRSNGADPWLFFHDGNYYYIATHGSRLDLYKAANIGDLPNASYKTIYKPEQIVAVQTLDDIHTVIFVGTVIARDVAVPAAVACAD